MENLVSTLTSAKLEDLKPDAKATGGSNLIEPTAEELGLIMADLKAGKTYKEIKQTRRRTVGESKLGFSYGQIKMVETGMKNEIVVKEDVSKLSFLSDDGQQVFRKCGTCTEYPCVCLPPEPEEEPITK